MAKRSQVNVEQMAGKDESLRPWRRLDSRSLLSHPPRLEVSLDRVALPDGRVVEDYLQLRVPDHVVVAALDEAGHFVFERQYKHGVGAVSLTLPSGGIEAGEDPEAAGRRELLEETGLEAARWRGFGAFVIGANSHIARAHLFLAEGARQVAEPASGDLEEMEILALAPTAARRALAEGQVPVMSSALALSLALPWALGECCAG